jgi:hypothetical protein
MSGEILTGTTLGPHVTLYHDGEGAVFSIKNTSGYGSGLPIEFNEFGGSFSRWRSSYRPRARWHWAVRTCCDLLCGRKRTHRSRPMPALFWVTAPTPSISLG